MKKKNSNLKIKIILFITAFFALLVVSYFVSAFIQAAMEIKNNHSSIEDNLIRDYIILIKSPFSTICAMTTAKNPIWFLCLFVSLCAAAYYGFYKCKPKDYKIESQYAVHGSSRWSYPKELTNDEALFAVSTQRFIEDYKNRLEASEYISSKYDGILVGMYKNYLYFQGMDSSLPNRNHFILAGPGSGKTTAYMITNVCFSDRCSQVMIDPKGNVYEKTAEIKRKQGYEVYCINFADMYHSSHYNPLDYVENERDAATVTYAIVSSKNDPKNKDIWFTSQSSFLKALILYAKYEFPPNKVNLPSILDFLQDTDMTEDEETGLSDMDIIFLKLNKKHPARRAYDLGFKKSKGKTRMSIVTSLLATLMDFISDDVGEFMKQSDFFFNEIGKRKIALYVIIPTLDKSWESSINLFFTQMFNELFKLGSQNHTKLPSPVQFWFDEFVNCGKFETYETFLAMCREYGISNGIIIQNITQIQDKYGHDTAESIIGNCAIKICLGNVNNTSQKYFSDMLGQSTVKIDTGGTSSSEGRSASRSTSTSYGYAARPLMGPDEIENMNKRDELFKMSNHHPFIFEKTYYFDLLDDYIEKFKCKLMDYKVQVSGAALEIYGEEKEE